MRHFSKLAMVFACMAVVGTAKPAVAQQPTPPEPARVGVVDVARILKEHPLIKAQVEKIESDLENFDTQFKEKRENLQAMVESLKTLTPGTPGYVQMEERIASEDSKLRLEMMRKRKELVDAEARIYYDNYNHIATAVRTIAEYYKIDLVLRYNSEAMQLENQETVIRGVMKNVVYHNPKLDLTAVVMEMLNRQMASNSQGTPVK